MELDVDYLYTDEVKREIYATKAELPKDFPLVTVEREVFIIIRVYQEYFAWRTVEDRLAIAIELEKLKKAIERTGVGCLIEMVTLADDEKDDSDLYT